LSFRATVQHATSAGASDLVAEAAADVLRDETQLVEAPVHRGPIIFCAKPGNWLFV